MSERCLGTWDIMSLIISQALVFPLFRFLVIVRGPDINEAELGTLCPQSYCLQVWKCVCMCVRFAGARPSVKTECNGVRLKWVLSKSEFPQECGCLHASRKGSPYSVALRFWPLASGLWPLASGQITTFRNLDAFLSSVKERETPSLLGPLDRAKLSPSTWTGLDCETQQNRRLSPSFPWRQKQIQFPKCFQLFGMPDDGQSPETQRFWVVYTIVRTVWILFCLCFNDRPSGLVVRVPDC
jgi:hypothetical protein